MRFQLLLTFSLLFSSQLHAQCDQKILFSGMHLLDFDKRTTVGEDETIPVKNKITSLSQEFDVKEIEVTSMSSKIPFFIMKNGKRTEDPASKTKNLALADQRRGFLEKQLSGIPAKLKLKSSLEGPDFKWIDQNDRWKTKETAGYPAMVKSLFESNKTHFESALIKSPDDLLKSETFSNLYQAKFKPFHGFKIVVYGCEKKVTDDKSGKSSTKQ